MRTLLLAFAIILGLAAFPPRQHPLLAAPTTVASADVQQTQPQTPQPPPQVNVQVHSEGGWHPSPVWIAIGAIGAILLILIIVLIARSGGGSSTTVVR
jgi:hypothetical protein